MTRLIFSLATVTLFALRGAAAGTPIETVLTNEPAAKSELLVKAYPFPDLDVREYNPFLLSSETSAYPVGSACNNISDGQICADRPAYGSGLHYLANAVKGTKFPFPIYISHTDRGPNQDCGDLAELPEYNEGTEYADRTGKGFPIPRFSPTVFSWSLDAKTGIKLVKHFELKNSKGEQILGRSNSLNDDTNYGYACRGDKLELTPAGIDFEDVHPAGDGIHFWGSDEYSPSVFLFDAHGEVKLRLLPDDVKLENVTTASAGYPILKNLPGVLVNRRQNRGFENLAVSPDGKTLIAILQSPMGDTKKDEIKPTNVIRAVKVDISDKFKPKYVGMYAFLASLPTDFTKGKKVKPSDLKNGAAQYLGEDVVLLLERADNAGMKLWVIDFRTATNLKGTPYESTLQLESTRTPEADFNITMAHRTKVFESDEIEGGDKYFTKDEGIAVMSPTVVMTVTDNDFGLGQGGRSQVDLLHLTAKLPYVNDVNTKGTKCNFKTCHGDKCYATLSGPAKHYLGKDACELYGGKLGNVFSTAALKAVLPEVGNIAVWVDGALDKWGYGYLLKNGKLYRAHQNNKYAVLCEVPRPASCPANTYNKVTAL
ncbi:hypothetical protein HDV00_012149 [Rhizophlyctis rosea]|nr:hypothetical protein HDV00_012149 [Rhizophlyctis rosea]